LTAVIFIVSASIASKVHAVAVAHVRQSQRRQMLLEN
jgi:hypothetical protein